MRLTAKRIYILGTMGGGKSTVARKLSKILNIPHYDLDDIYWKRKYDVRRSDKECQKRLDKLTKKKEWIIEGCFSRWIESGVKRSQLVIWLDFPFHVVTYRFLKRFMMRTGKSKDNWKDVWRIIGQNYDYTRHKNSNLNKRDKWGNRTRRIHASLIKKYNKQLVYIKNKRELEDFLVFSERS